MRDWTHLGRGLRRGRHRRLHLRAVEPHRGLLRDAGAVPVGSWDAAGSGVPCGDALPVPDARPAAREREGPVMAAPSAPPPHPGTIVFADADTGEENSMPVASVPEPLRYAPDQHGQLIPVVRVV